MKTAPLFTVLLFGSLGQANEARPTIAWSSTGLSATTYERLDALSLERQAVVRLVQDGFAVVDLSAAPQVIVRLKDSAEGIVLEVSGALGATSQQLALDSTPVAELHLEIVQRSVTLAKSVLGPRMTHDGTSMSKLDLSASAGVVRRTRSFDAAVSANVGVSISPFWGLHLKGGLALSSSSHISVQDWHVLVGPRGALQLGPSWTLELALLGGTRIHSAKLIAPLEGSGIRLDVMGALFARVRYELKWGIGIELGVAGGVSPSVIHPLGMTTLWERGPVTLEATLGVFWQTGSQ